MKKIAFIVFAMLVPSWVMAQDMQLPIDTLWAEVDTISQDTVPVVLIVDDMSHAIVHQDSALLQLMLDKRVGRVRGEQIVDGYRVQIFASNNQQVAKNTALSLQQRVEPLLDVPVYALSEPPFWKVRIGNFKTREDANAYKEVFLTMFPEMVGSTYVVPDKIILIQ